VKGLPDLPMKFAPCRRVAVRLLAPGDPLSRSLGQWSNRPPTSRNAGTPGSPCMFSSSGTSRTPRHRGHRGAAYMHTWQDGGTSGQLGERARWPSWPEGRLLDGLRVTRNAPAGDGRTLSESSSACSLPTRWRLPSTVYSRDNQIRKKSSFFHHPPPSWQGSQRGDPMAG